MKLIGSIYGGVSALEKYLQAFGPESGADGNLALVVDGLCCRA
jgi:hypothetical protein